MSRGKEMVSRRITIIAVICCCWLDLSCCADFPLVANSWGYSLVVECRLVLVEASLVVKLGF